jgi:transcriptional regulator with XRE-family HTH domain
VNQFVLLTPKGITIKIVIGNYKNGYLLHMREVASLGERALTVRKRAGKTQAEMAKFLGVSTATWQKIERNEGIPSGETLLSFVKLDVNPGWILTGLGPELMTDYPASQSKLLDRKLFDAIAIIADQICASEEMDLTRVEFSRYVVDAYNRLIERADDPTDVDELKVLLPWLKRQLEKSLDPNS